MGRSSLPQPRRQATRYRKRGAESLAPRRPQRRGHRPRGGTLSSAWRRRSCPARRCAWTRVASGRWLPHREGIRPGRTPTARRIATSSFGDQSHWSAAQRRLRDAEPPRAAPGGAPPIRGYRAATVRSPWETPNAAGPSTSPARARGPDGCRAMPRCTRRSQPESPPGRRQPSDSFRPDARSPARRGPTASRRWP